MAEKSDAIFPPFLGGHILLPGMLERGVIPLCSFCLASSSTYILNDIVDREKDLFHPKKKHRALTSGKIPLYVARVLAVLLLTVALVLGSRVSQQFLYYLIGYLIISFVYSIKFKEMPIIDIFCISAGFILRLEAGGVAFGISISEWLFLSVFLLSLFLSTGKRLCEKYSMGDDAGNHRKALLTYPPGFLEGTLYMTGGTVLVTYTMYAISRKSLVFTVPLCCFGLLRYIFRVKSGLGGDPTESLLKDLPLFIVGLLWVGMVGWGIYGR